MSVTLELWGPARAYAFGRTRRSALGQLNAPGAPSLEDAISNLEKIAEQIKNERALDAGDFSDYVAKTKERQAALFDLKRAQDGLDAEQKRWEAFHRDQAPLQAAQTAVDDATNRLQPLTDQVNTLRAAVDQHAKNIQGLREQADGWIAYVPQDQQADARRIIDPCYRPSVGRRDMGRPFVVNATPVPAAPRAVPVRVVGMYVPPRPQGPLLAQPLVEVKPQVSVPISAPININLGGLPITVALLAGSGITFLVRSGVPKGWPQNVATIVGAGLALGGVVNMFIPRGQGGGGGAAPAPAGPPPPPPSGAASPETAPPAFTPPSPQAFSTAQAEVVSPKPDTDVAHVGWFLTGDRIPVDMRLYNPSGEAVTFNLEFEWDEFPSALGYNLAQEHSSATFQLSLGPGEEQNKRFELPIKSGSKWTSIAVAMALYKKRSPAENRFLVTNFSFNVT